MPTEQKMSQADKAYIVAKIFSDQHNIICFNKHFYLYNEGIWRLESDENTRSWIIKEYIKNFFTPPKKQIVNEIIDYIQTETYEKYRKEIKYFNENNHTNTINIKSGILNLDTLKVTPYTKEAFCFYKLPFDYIENPKCNVLKDFLTSSMSYDLDAMKDIEMFEYRRVMKFIQEWLGYSMVAGYKLEKCLLMIGEGANGKSMLQDIWEHIIGKFNCSYVDLKFINDGSQIFMTRNKLVNFSKDLESNQQLDTGITKAAVSGQVVIANEKHKGQVEMGFTAKLVIACNELPYIKNASMSVKRRFHILPFTRVFQEDEQDKDLINKLKSEDSHIFSWAVNGLRNLKARGGFDVPERCKYSMANYIKDNDSVELWLNEYDIKCVGTNCKTTEVYRDYKNYCIESGLKPFSNNKLYKKLETKNFKRKKINGREYFENVKLINQP